MASAGARERRSIRLPARFREDFLDGKAAAKELAPPRPKQDVVYDDPGEGGGVGEVFIVECVLDVRHNKTSKQQEALVRWKGAWRPSEKETWEPLCNLTRKVRQCRLFFLSVPTRAPQTQRDVPTQALNDAVMLAAAKGNFEPLKQQRCLNDEHDDDESESEAEDVDSDEPYEADNGEELAHEPFPFIETDPANAEGLARSNREGKVSFQPVCPSEACVALSLFSPFISSILRAVCLKSRVGNQNDSFELTIVDPRTRKQHKEENSRAGGWRLRK
jgi:hypothetical protein